MDLNFIAEMYIPIIVVACLIVGYIIKKWIKDIENKWIPTTCCILGAVLACLTTQQMDITTITAGAISGLSSTGLHEMFTQIIENK